MNLNPFEIEILRLLSIGKAQRELPALLNKTQNVIDGTIKRARDKNGMNTTVELVLTAYKNNLL